MFNPVHRPSKYACIASRVVAFLINTCGDTEHASLYAETLRIMISEYTTSLRRELIDTQDCLASKLHDVFGPNVCYHLRKFIDALDLPIIRFVRYLSIERSVSLHRDKSPRALPR